MKLDDTYQVLKRSVTFTLNLHELESSMSRDAYRILLSKVNYPEDKIFSITVPRGYISDFQTLPEWFTNRFKVKSKWRKAFLLQDFLYETITSKAAKRDGIGALDALMTKEIQDAIAVTALKSLGMGWFRRTIIHSVFKRTAIDKGERMERRDLIAYLLRNQYRIGLRLDQRTTIKGPGAPIQMQMPYNLFVVEHEATELRLRAKKVTVVQYPNITIPLYISK